MWEEGELWAATIVTPLCHCTASPFHLYHHCVTVLHHHSTSTTIVSLYLITIPPTPASTLPPLHLHWIYTAPPKQKNYNHCTGLHTTTTTIAQQPDQPDHVHLCFNSLFKTDDLVFTMAFCLKGKAMVMVPPVSSGGYLNSERLRENRQEQTCLQILQLE